MKIAFFVALLSLSSSLFAESTQKSCFSIKGMHCGSCRDKIESKLKEDPGIKSADVSVKKEVGDIEFDPEKIDEAKIVALIAEAGYKGIKTECQK